MQFTKAMIHHECVYVYCHVKLQQTSNEKNLCEEDKMFLNSEIIKENVVLGTKSKTSTNFVDVMSNVETIYDRRSTRWWEKPCINKHLSNPTYLHHKSYDQDYSS